MDRQIAGKSAITRGAAKAVDPYVDRLVKLLPSEGVATYLVLDGILGTLKQPVVVWVVTLVMLILTPVYLRRATHVRSVRQIVLSTVSFLVWAIAVGSALQQSLGSYYQPACGSLLVVLFTFVVPIFYSGPLTEPTQPS